MLVEVLQPPRDVDYQTFFGQLLPSYLVEGGSVLDVGAGTHLHAPLREVRLRAGWMCGVDPSQEVMSNPDLDEKYQCTLEQWERGGRTFDLAFAYNVVEHVADPTAFVGAVVNVLHAGGWFWFLTPNARHPFCVLSRVFGHQAFKRLVRRAYYDPGLGYTVNEYPSYYRMNSPKAVAALAGRVVPAAFDTLRVYYMEAGFDPYFPTALRWLPRWYDRAISPRFPSRRLILICGLRRAQPTRDA